MKLPRWSLTDIVRHEYAHALTFHRPEILYEWPDDDDRVSAYAATNINEDFAKLLSTSSSTKENFRLLLSQQRECIRWFECHLHLIPEASEILFEQDGQLPVIVNDQDTFAHGGISCCVLSNRRIVPSLPDTTIPRRYQYDVSEM
jgi:hypothetical protein